LTAISNTGDACEHFEFNDYPDNPFGSTSGTYSLNWSENALPDTGCLFTLSIGGPGCTANIEPGQLEWGFQHYKNIGPL